MTTGLYYETANATPDAPWLVLIHGLFGNLDNLAVIKRHFSQQYNVLSIDLPDHGKSDRAPVFSLPHTVAELNKVLLHVGAREYHLLGHSLGGKAAMLYALHYPEHIASLIVADIAPVSYPARHTDIIAGLKAVDLEQITQRKQADSELAKYVDNPGVRQFLLKSLYQNAQQQWQWRFNIKGLSEAYDNIRDWPDNTLQFNKPTLFIKGSESDYIQSDYKAAIGKHFPRARAHIIEGTGHWLHAEKPAAFNNIVEGFLRRQD